MNQNDFNPPPSLCRYLLQNQVKKYSIISEIILCNIVLNYLPKVKCISTKKKKTFKKYWLKKRYFTWLETSFPFIQIDVIYANFVATLFLCCYSWCKYFFFIERLISFPSSFIKFVIPLLIENDMTKENKSINNFMMWTWN